MCLQYCWQLCFPCWNAQNALNECERNCEVIERHLISYSMIKLEYENVENSYSSYHHFGQSIPALSLISEFRLGWFRLRCFGKSPWRHKFNGSSGGSIKGRTHDVFHPHPILVSDQGTKNQNSNNRRLVGHFFSTRTRDVCRMCTGSDVEQGPRVAPMPLAYTLRHPTPNVTPMTRDYYEFGIKTVASGLFLPA